MSFQNIISIKFLDHSKIIIIIIISGTNSESMRTVIIINIPSGRMAHTWIKLSQTEAFKQIPRNSGNY